MESGLSLETVKFSRMFVSIRNEKHRTRFCPMQVRLPTEKGRKCGIFFLTLVTFGAFDGASFRTLFAGTVSMNRSGLNSFGFSQYLSLVFNS